MAALPEQTQHMTESKYLAFERASEIKHEYIDGHVYAMSGASESHNIITSNVIAALHSQLRGRSCKTYPSHMKVRTPSTRSYVYPDITVVCAEAQFDDDQRDLLLNPTAIFEVLSSNTERFDRGTKFQRYREIDSLQQYILIAQDRTHIECFTRQDNGLWLFSEAAGMDASLELPAIACTLPLADVYEQVTFAAEADQS